MKLVKVKKADAPDMATLFKQFGLANSKVNNAASDLWAAFAKDPNMKLDVQKQKELNDFLNDYISEFAKTARDVKTMLDDIRKKWKA